jgi:hypothetical protein
VYGGQHERVRRVDPDRGQQRPHRTDGRISFIATGNPGRGEFTAVLLHDDNGWSYKRAEHWLVEQASRELLASTVQ